MSLYPNNHLQTHTNIIILCNFTICQVVCHFTKNSRRDNVDSFVDDLQSSVNKRIRGDKVIFQENRYDYEENIIIQIKLIGLRVYFGLLLGQVIMPRNFELDEYIINNYIQEVRIGLQESAYVNVNLRID